MAIPDAELKKLFSYCDVIDLIGRFGGDARKSGNKLETCCLFHSEKTPSMIIDAEKKYHCFGCGVHGDLITLVREKEGLDFIDAVRWLSRFSGYVPEGLNDSGEKLIPSKEPVLTPISEKVDGRRKWEVITPVPDKVPAIKLSTFNKWIHSLKRRIDPVAMWPYYDGGNNLLGVDARYEYQIQDDDGNTVTKKDVITWTWCRPIEDESKGIQWHASRWPIPAPLYGLNRLTAQPDTPVIIGEGCKAADAANRLDGYVGLTWCGGTNKATKFKDNNWNPLTGRDVIIWADADEPGIKAAWYVAQHLIEIDAKSVRVVSVQGLPKGWDLADDAPEGVDIHQLLTDAVLVDDEWLHLNNPDRGSEKIDDSEELFDFPDHEGPPQQPPANDQNTGTPDNDDQYQGEVADANFFMKSIAGRAWYCPGLAAANKSDIESGWLVWDGKRLALSDDGAIMRMSRAAAVALSKIEHDKAANYKADIQAEYKKDKKERSYSKIKGWQAKKAQCERRAEQVQSKKRIEVMIALARMDSAIHIKQDELDGDPNLLNCQNCIVNLQTGDTIAHDPKYRCTKITAVPYLPDADRTVLDKLLNRSLMSEVVNGPGYISDEARIDFLKQSIGHALYGHQRLQKFYLCIGDGGDGKGTLFEALLDALGNYAMKADMQSFVKQKLSGHKIRDDVANMAGARIVIASEINRGDALDGAFMKTISGEDKQRVRHLFGKEFEFRPICTLFMQANHQPYVDSQDHAIWRRLVNIPFGPVLHDDERDPAVRAQLHDPETGGAALLAWAIEGAIETYNIQRIPEPKSVQESTATYRHDMNPLAAFIIEDLRFSAKENHKNCYIEQKAVKKCYNEWLANSGLDDKGRGEVSGKRICAQLRACGAVNKGKSIEGKTVKVWYGVTLRNDHDLKHEYKYGPHTPADECHYKVIAETKAVEITQLPHHVLDPHTHAEKNTMVFSDAPTRAPNSKRGNWVIDKNNINNGKQNNTNELPDLDSLGDGEGDGGFNGGGGF